MKYLTKCRGAAKVVLATAALLCLTVASAFAAQDGDRGSTSTGTVSVTVIVEQGIQITDLQDVNLTIRREPGAGNFETSEEFCISGTAGSQFSVTAFTQDQPDSFTLRSDSNELIPFTLRFTPQLSSGQFDELQPNEPSTLYSVSSFDDCNAGNNSQIRVVFNEADILASTSLEFVGDLFITIALQ